VKLQTTPVEKDLGVFVDDTLKFRDHVCYAVNKASRVPGLIRLTFSWIDEETLLRLFTTLVRPHLKYGNIIWDLDIGSISYKLRRYTNTLLS